MINELPKDWKWVKLGEAVQVLDNLRKPINSSERQNRVIGKKQTELYPYYGATGQVGWIDSFITNGEYILVGEDGAPFLDIYKEKAYKIKGKTWVNNHAHVLQNKENLTINDFILHYLNSVNYRQYVNGTTRLKLTKSSLVDIQFPLPPLTTQQAIVTKIEELFSELDKGIENLRTAQQQLKTYRQSVLKWAFEGKLTTNRIDNFSKVVNSNEQDLIQKEILQSANSASDKGELPKGWKWVKLGAITKKKSLKSLPKDYPDAKFIGMDCIEPHTLKPFFLYDFKEFKSAGNVFKANQVLYGRMRPYLNKVYKAEFDGTCSGEFIILECENNYSPDLLKYVLHSKDFVSFANRITTGDRPRISYEEISDYDIPLAPIEEQHQIVQAIESRLSVADKMEESITQSLQQSEALRQSILKKAFEGRLV